MYFLVRLDAETYLFQLLECSIAAYSTVCMPCTYGTASYNFCSLQVMHRIDLPSVILQLWLFLITHTVNMSAFYSFGVSAGDTQLPQEDDSSSAPINLTIPIPFFGSLERTLYVSPLLVLCI